MRTLSTVSYPQGDTLPNFTFGASGVPAWLDAAGSVVDFSSGYTFTAKVYRNGVLQFTKSSSITGASTAPNVTINWASTGEIGDLNPGVYLLRVTATSSSETRSAKVTLIIEDGTR